MGLDRIHQEFQFLSHHMLFSYLVFLLSLLQASRMLHIQKTTEQKPQSGLLVAENETQLHYRFDGW